MLPSLELSPAQRATLLRAARQALRTDIAAPTTDDPRLLAKLPCFVSLHTRTGRLRGCLGCLKNESTLIQRVAELALDAAYRDPRFDPAKPDELESLVLAISVLSEPRRLPSLEALKPGPHGLVVTDGRRRGVLLGKVATELNWGAEQFVRETCGKAGLDPEKWRDYEIQCFDEIAFSEEDTPS